MSSSKLFENASLYTDKSWAQKYAATTMYSRLFPKLKWLEVENIIDVGTGPGDVLIETVIPLMRDIAKGPDSQEMIKHLTIKGVDTSQDFLKHATNWYGTRDITFEEMDFGKELSVGKQYTKVISSSVFHWIPDLARCMKNVYNHLVPGGQACFFFFPSLPWLDIMRTVSEVPKWAELFKSIEVQPMGYVYQDSKDPVGEFRALIGNLGLPFTIEYCEFQTHDLWVTEEMAKKSYSTIDPYLGNISSAEEEAYLNDVMNEFKARGSFDSDTKKINLGSKCIGCVLNKDYEDART